MKRIQTIILLSIAIALMLFISCEEEASTTSLRVYLKDRVSGTRELYSPTGESLDIYGYIIEGSGPNDQSLSITSHSPQVEISGLMIGTWNLVVTGVNQQGTPLATGEATFQLTTQANTVEILVDTLYGEGTLQFGLYWGPEVFTGITLEMNIRDQEGVSTDVSSSVTVTSSQSSALFSDQLTAGIYEVHYSVLSNGVVIAGGIDIVRVLDEKLTDVEVTLDVHKETPEATGMNISSSLGSEIEGDIVGIDSLVAPNTQLSATYTPSNTSSSTYDVTWYLDGVEMSTGDTVDFTTFTGPHRLDAIARGEQPLSVGADTMNFQVSVGDNEGVPVLVNSYSAPVSDEQGSPLFIDSIKDTMFLLDGNLLIAGSAGLQLCDVHQDALEVLGSYTSNNGGVQSDPYPTLGITSLAYDSSDQMVFTANGTSGLIVAYTYDGITEELTKSDSASESDHPWSDNLSNIVLDPITNHLFLLDRDTSQMHVLNYDGGTFTLVLSAALGQFFHAIADGEHISISDALDTLIVSSPSNNTFHSYQISYDAQGAPSLMFLSNNLLSSSFGTVERGYVVQDNLHLLTSTGWHLYTYEGSSLSYLWQEQIGTVSEAMKEVIYDSTYTQGWVVSEDTGMKVYPVDIYAGVPVFTAGSAALPSLSPLSAARSPQGNYMALAGSSSFNLYRLNDQ